MAELGSNQFSHSGSRGNKTGNDGFVLLESIWTSQFKKNFQGQHGYDQGMLETTHLSGGFWRPWVDAGGQQEEAGHGVAQAVSEGMPGMTEASGKLSRYRHPVRLFWPKSKCYDYLYQEAEALLKNFPIQATISFYEDSDSEDEIEEQIREN
ncbi:PREDICTED: protein ripply2 [Miniopterus natalensis]|uniref:protein ripply2 n=1 Tax=Miniopterus natalensis TaxID=291302 RepID=UPI0007A6A7C7|nr:PREDICTED: protein ripply2 [Miniopterus natalensis]